MATFQRAMLPPARSFYEREIGSLTRADRKGWAKGRCPFHDSKSGKSFSANMENGGFFCHGCGEKGDMVHFYMRRYNAPFLIAAKALGAVQNVTPAERLHLDAAKSQRAREREQASASKEAERSHRIKLRGELYTASEIWKRACERLSELRRGAVPTRLDEEELQWKILSLALPNLRDAEKQYCLAAGLEYENE